MKGVTMKSRHVVQIVGKLCANWRREDSMKRILLKRNSCECTVELDWTGSGLPCRLCLLAES